MAVRSKGRRKITVNGRKYLWYVKVDRDSGEKVLHIISEDKKFIVHRTYPAWEIDQPIIPRSVRHVIESHLKNKKNKAL